MQKIPSLYVRDPETNLRYIKNEVHPDCEWVIAGEGVPTRKFDGTCVMFDDDGHWWARREIKPGRKTPPNFIRVNVDDNTGKVMGWIPIEESSYIKQFTEAIEAYRSIYEPGTYELCGPKVGDNGEKLLYHWLVKHGSVKFDRDKIPTDFESLGELLGKINREQDVEGIVWHHPDGRMAKIKAKDFPR